MAIYGDGYRYSLYNSLADQYESVWWTLGDQDFSNIVLDYISAQPSKNYNLNVYGEDFSQFISSHSYTQRFPFLSELAKFEYTYNQLHNLAWKPPTLPIKPEAFHENCKFKFIEASQLKSFSWDLMDHWEKRQSATSTEQNFILENKTSYYWFYRIEFKKYIIKLNPFEFRVIQALHNGFNLQSALESQPEFPEQIEPQTIHNLMTHIINSETLLEVTE